jgi:hypothetical protein
MSALALAFGSAGSRLLPEEREFRAWMQTHNQAFVGSEYRKRYSLFMANPLIVKLHNSRSTFTLSLNKFAALSNSEF